MLRRLILAAADSPRIRRFVNRYGMGLGASRFVGGVTLDDVVVTLRSLNEQGLRTNTSLLGEHVPDREAALAVTATYEEVLGRIAAEQLQTNVALKLTHLGVALDEELAYANVERLVAEAGRLGSFIRIDMEDSGLVDVTLRIYRRLREAGHENVGTVLQSYLYRTPGDLESLLPLKPNLRIVKGAYKEPADVAYPKKADVDRAYDELVARCIAEAPFTAVATHDEKRIEHAVSLGAGPDRMELQMLFGVRSQLQLDLVHQGHRVLVATPFGPDWYPYLMRRLAERPANLLFFVRNALESVGILGPFWTKDSPSRVSLSSTDPTDLPLARTGCSVQLQPTRAPCSALQETTTARSPRARAGAVKVVAICEVRTIAG